MGKFEETCAQKLYQIVKDQFGLKQDTKLWPEWFAKLQEKEVSKERIKKAIVWYAKHALDKMAPHVEDAAEFYREFGRIENAIRREEDTSANVEIMPELQPLIDRLLLECYWPKGSARDLPGVVQRSFDNYAAWWKKRGKLLKRLPPEQPQPRVPLGEQHALHLKRLAIVVDLHANGVPQAPDAYLHPACLRVLGHVVKGRLGDAIEHRSPGAVQSFQPG